MVKLPSLMLGQESFDRVQVVVAVLKETKGTRNVPMSEYSLIQTS
jgi:hypothetical protein